MLPLAHSIVGNRARVRRVMTLDRISIALLQKAHPLLYQSPNKRILLNHVDFPKMIPPVNGLGIVVLLLLPSHRRILLNHLPVTIHNKSPSSAPQGYTAVIQKSDTPLPIVSPYVLVSDRFFRSLCILWFLRGVHAYRNDS